MEKRRFDYKPLACNKNDREFKWDVKKDKEIPENALYMKLGDMNSEIIRYLVLWGDDAEIRGIVNEYPGIRPISRFH